MHYLDDFLLFGSPGTSDCQKAFHTVMQECSRLGVPIAEHKTEGPSQVLTFLGIEVDLGRMAQGRSYRACKGKLTYGWEKVDNKKMSTITDRPVIACVLCGSPRSDVLAQDDRLIFKSKAASPQVAAE